MAGTAPLLECRAVSARYGGITVCREVYLSVARGEIVALLGPNGAGKTSLLGSISGIVSGGGEVVLDGNDLQRLPADRRAHLGLRLVPEGRGLFPELTVRENLRLGSRLAPMARRQELIDRAIELFPILGDRLEQHAGDMSGG